MLGTRRSVGQFIPQYRTDGQYDHTKTWACVRKAQSTETLRGCAERPHDHVDDPTRKPPSEARASGAIQNSGRWSVRRAERCEESRQRMSGSDRLCWKSPFSLMTENSQDRWCVFLAAQGGPHQSPQKRSLALVSILQSLAATEIANALHLPDFRRPAIFEFFNTILR